MVVRDWRWRAECLVDRRGWSILGTQKEQECGLSFWRMWRTDCSLRLDGTKPLLEGSFTFNSLHVGKPAHVSIYRLICQDKEYLGLNSGKLHGNTFQIGCHGQAATLR